MKNAPIKALIVIAILFFTPFSPAYAHVENTPVPASFTASSVDESFIQKFIIGPSPEKVQIVARLLAKIRATDPEIAKYMDLVFTHLSGFRIAIYSLKDFKTQGDIRYAMYYAEVKTIVLPEEGINENNFMMLDTIRHEMRHAAMHTMQLMLGKRISNSAENYFPNNTSQQSKVADLMGLGDKRIMALKNLLELESKQQISEADRQRLAQLRDEVRATYHAHYQISMNETIPNEVIVELEKLIGKKLRVGEIVNIDKYRTVSAGDLYIKSMEPNKENPSETVITFVYQDPLQAFANRCIEQIPHVKKNYREEDFVYEREAYLYGSLPIAIIKNMYPELFDYTNHLLAQAQQAVAEPMDTQALQYVSYQDFLSNTVLKILKTPEFFKSRFADTFIVWAKAASSVGKIEEAKTALQTLIQQGYHVGTATIELAQIEYSTGNYKNALEHFNQAKKMQVKFSEEARQAYDNAKTYGAGNNTSSVKMTAQQPVRYVTYFDIQYN